MNRLATSERVSVIGALVEGMSINATCRMTGVAKHTVLKLLKDMGCAAAAYHDAHVLVLPLFLFQRAALGPSELMGMFSPGHF